MIGRAFQIQRREGCRRAPRLSVRGRRRSHQQSGQLGLSFGSGLFEGSLKVLFDCFLAEAEKFGCFRNTQSRRYREHNAQFASGQAIQARAKASPGICGTDVGFCENTAHLADQGAIKLERRPSPTGNIVAINPSPSLTGRAIECMFATH
jgi:hypothetical protein